MTTRLVVAIARNDVAMLLTEPAVYAVLLLMPILLIAFLRPLFGAALEAQGYTGSTGAELAVPGLAVMFSFYLINLVGYSIHDERRWNTWPRLTATGAPTLILLLAKGTVPVGTSLGQQAVLFGAGFLLFDLPLRGSLLALVVLAVALDCCVVSLGMAVAAIASTARQISVFGNISTLLLAGLGGALTPIALLPVWAQQVAPFTPSYWAVSGFHRVLRDGAGPVGVAPQVGVLLVFASCFAFVAGYRITRRETRGAT